MKLLYYNWIQFDNREGIGGGVNVYQKNLIEYLVNNTDDEVYFLSSGWAYDAFNQSTRIEKTDNIFSKTNRCHTYEVINSTIMAPAFENHMNPGRYVKDLDTVNIFAKFIKEFGAFDVIHFNNMEGIYINVLKLKKIFPNTKFIVSIHNYQLICPLVQYFQDNTNKICNDFHAGTDCLNCAFNRPKYKDYAKRASRYWILHTKFKIVKPISDLLIKFKCIDKSRELMGGAETMKAEKYQLYRRHNIEQLNKYADAVLSVSQRTAEIMMERGLKPGKSKVLYIGTKVAEAQVGKSIAHKGSVLTIAYLGYKRIDKGFYFLLEALSLLDTRIASKVNLVLAVRGATVEEVYSKVPNISKVTIFNGYSHHELKHILNDVDLGVIPVLWEDNLPQVSIEMVSMGVPILCSSFGGASELCGDNDFVFEGGNSIDFINKLSKFVEHPNLIDKYWGKAMKLKTMGIHYRDLMQFYE